MRGRCSHSTQVADVATLERWRPPLERPDCDCQAGSAWVAWILPSERGEGPSNRRTTARAAYFAYMPCPVRQSGGEEEEWNATQTELGVLDVVFGRHAPPWSNDESLCPPLLDRRPDFLPAVSCVFNRGHVRGSRRTA